MSEREIRTTLVECIDWRHSHPDTMRWRAYYAAFEAHHGRPSTSDEFDPHISLIVDRVMSVVRRDLAELANG